MYKRQSLDDSPLGVRIVTAEGETIYANRAILDIYGYDSIEELITTPIKMRYLQVSYAEFQIRKEKRRQGVDVPSEYEVSIIRKNGDVRQLQVFRKEVLWDGERQFQVIYNDITDRKRMEEALQFARFSLDNAGDTMICVDRDARFIDVNNAFCRSVGYSREELLSMTVHEIDPDYSAEIWPEFWEKIKQRGHLRFESCHRTKEGKVFPVEITASFFKYMGKEYHCSFARDITDRKQAEEGLRASREQMRALAGRLQEVREEERTDIAREIHDELGGALTGMKVDVSFLIKSALKIKNEAARTSLLAGMDSVIKSIDTTIHAVRRIAMELRPGILDDLGLVAALEWQLNDFEKRTGIRCEFFPPVEDISFDADLSTALFRIVQEALTNVARHSGATEVRVRLRADADSSTLEVEDNGNCLLYTSPSPRD